MPVYFHDKTAVSVGDVVRYTCKFTGPLFDNDGQKLDVIYLRVHNTSSVLYRPAYLSGPWTVCVSVYNSDFDSYKDNSPPHLSEYPVYDPSVKASSSFWTKIDLRPTGVTNGKHAIVIEITSQVLFGRIKVPFTVTIGSSRQAAHDHSSHSTITEWSGLAVVKHDTQGM
jgi:hypothetical protein